MTPLLRTYTSASSSATQWHTSKLPSFILLNVLGCWTNILVGTGPCTTYWRDRRTKRYHFESVDLAGLCRSFPASRRRHWVRPGGTKWNWELDEQRIPFVHTPGPRRVARTVTLFVSSTGPRPVMVTPATVAVGILNTRSVKVICTIDCILIEG